MMAAMEMVEGVTATGSGTLPCSVLARYPVIGRRGPHKNELRATRGEVPYGTSDPEKQRVTKKTPRAQQVSFYGGPLPIVN